MFTSNTDHGFEAGERADFRAGLTAHNRAAQQTERTKGDTRVSFAETLRRRLGFGS